MTGENRRHFLRSALCLIAAPAIVRASSLMPISVERWADGGVLLGRTWDYPTTFNWGLCSGLEFYDLRKPALTLFPTVTPLRNDVPTVEQRIFDAFNYLFQRDQHDRPISEMA